MKPHPLSWLAAACCAVALLLTGCNSSGSNFSPSPVIVGSGVIVSEFRTLAPFDSIDAGIAETQIVIMQGGPQSVWIETDDNIIDEIDMVVVGGVLLISSNVNYDTNHDVQIRIDMTTVQSLRMSGVGSMDATGLSSTGTLEVALTGVGSIDLAGTVDTYDALHQGVGEIDAEGLTARLADIESRGVGDCRITVTQHLDASIFGTGDIYYAFDAANPPTVTLNDSGLGDLIPI